MKKYKSLLGFMVVASFMFSFLAMSPVSAKEGADDNGGLVPMPPVTNPDDPTLGVPPRGDDKGGLRESSTLSGKVKPTYDIKTIKGARIRDNDQNREDFKNQIEASREAFKQKMEAARKEFEDGLKAKRDAFMAEVKAKKDEWRTAKADQKANFCQNANEIVNTRFNEAIAKITDLQTKVTDAISKLSTEGKDTTLATNALNASKQKLADAKAKLAETRALVPASCDTLTTEIFGNIKLGARATKDLLKESSNSLHQAIAELRTLRGEDKKPEDKTTSTTTTTPNTNSGTQQ